MPRYTSPYVCYHFNLNMQEVELGDLSKVIDIHKKLEYLKEPLGTQDSPARKCLDIKLENPNAKDGITNFNNLSFHNNDRLLLD